MKTFCKLSCVLLFLINCSISDANSFEMNDCEIFYDIKLANANNKYFPENTKLSAFYTHPALNGELYQFELVYKNNNWIPSRNFLLDGENQQLTVVYPALNLIDEKYVLIDLDKDIDYLMGTTYVNNSTPYANIEMNHLFTKLSFQVYTYDNANYTLSKIQLEPNAVQSNPFPTQARANLLRPGIFDVIANRKTFTFFQGKYYLPNEDFNEEVCEVLFFPQNRSARLPFYFTINGKTHQVLVDPRWASGHKYTFKIFYTEKGILPHSKMEMKNIDTIISQSKF